MYEVDNRTLFHPCYCGGTRFSSILLGKYRDCEVVRCEKCGQFRTYSEPSEESLKVKYSDALPKYSLEAAEEPERLESWERFSNEILDDLEKYAPQKGLLLDVGCNLGDLLVAGRSRGWQAEGLEINTAVANYLRDKGFQVYDTFLEKAGLPESHYDAAVANNVLEHVPEPIPFLQEMRRVVKPGGLIFMGVPCFDSPYPRLLKRDRWYSLLPDEHIWQFSENHLRGLLTSQGYEIVFYRRGSSDFVGRLSLNPKSWFRWMLYRPTALLGKGDFNSFVLSNAK